MLARGLPTLPAITLLTFYVLSKPCEGEVRVPLLLRRVHTQRLPVCLGTTTPTDVHSRQAAALKGGINF